MASRFTRPLTHHEGAARAERLKRRNVGSSSPRKRSRRVLLERAAEFVPHARFESSDEKHLDSFDDPCPLRGGLEYATSLRSRPHGSIESKRLLCVRDDNEVFEAMRAGALRSKEITPRLIVVSARVHGHPAKGDPVRSARVVRGLSGYRQAHERQVSGEFRHHSSTSLFSVEVDLRPAKSSLEGGARTPLTGKTHVGPVMRKRGRALTRKRGVVVLTRLRIKRNQSK